MWRAVESEPYACHTIYSPGFLSFPFLNGSYLYMLFVLQNIMEFCKLFLNFFSVPAFSGSNIKHKK